MRVSEQRFQAMNTWAHIIVVGNERSDKAALDDLAQKAITRVQQLENLWSRFLSTSEIASANNSNQPTEVSTETLCLVSKAIQAWKITNGAFDPTILRQLVDHGYSQTFEKIREGMGKNSESSEENPLRSDPTPAPGCNQIKIDDVARTIYFPPGLEFDPGGIGKGLASDIVTNEALEAGATGVMVNLGGDIVARGTPPTGQGWSIEITEDTLRTDAIATISFDGGAVATSVTTRRTWSIGDHRYHHLIDPITGDPTTNDIRLVSALANEGWLAEATTKAHIMGRPSADISRIPALIYRSSGEIETHAGIERFIS